ncbi:MAG: RNA polymerase sigma factor [Ktedonobacteraceae bacterium]
MATCFSSVTSNSWENQARVLRRLVRGWVYSTHIPLWAGEEEEVISDIVQEALCRTLERMRKAERQEATPVNSPDFLSRTIARNLFIDFIRKDKRIVPLSQMTHSSGEETFEFELADNAEDVNEQVFQQSIFNALAPEIANFPKKQKFALLVDIAKHTNFTTNEDMLRKSFLKVGVRLEDYLGWQPENTIERSRFASLLSISYKRVAHLNCMKPYMT